MLINPGRQRAQRNLVNWLGYRIILSKRFYHNSFITNDRSSNDDKSKSIPNRTTYLNLETRKSSNLPPTGSTSNTTSRNSSIPNHEEIISNALQKPAGPLYMNGRIDQDKPDHGEHSTTLIKPGHSDFFIPEVPLHENDGRKRNRVLVLCTGGTLTMAPDPSKGGALAPVEGAVTTYMKEMNELLNDNMPEVVVHEYSPFYDSSDLGPNEWAVLASDIKANYYHFDGFVVLMGTDTMAYVATALSFMLENLGKPVIFTGSQIPLSEPYNDARRNLIMSLIFASRDTIPEVCIFFHDRLLRACRATKVNTHRLKAFDSPNMDPLATIGITIDENEHLTLPRARGPLRLHSRMDTRILTIRLVPGFDDGVIKQLITANVERDPLKVLVLQLYGTGNAPSVKKSFLKVIGDAVDKGIIVVANTQCYTGNVLLGEFQKLIFLHFFLFRPTVVLSFWHYCLMKISKTMLFSPSYSRALCNWSCTC